MGKGVGVGRRWWSGVGLSVRFGRRDIGVCRDSLNRADSEAVLGLIEESVWDEVGGIGVIKDALDRAQ